MRAHAVGEKISSYIIIIVIILLSNDIISHFSFHMTGPGEYFDWRQCLKQHRSLSNPK